MQKEEKKEDKPAPKQEKKPEAKQEKPQTPPKEEKPAPKQESKPAPKQESKPAPMKEPSKVRCDTCCFHTAFTMLSHCFHIAFITHPLHYQHQPCWKYSNDTSSSFGRMSPMPGVAKSSSLMSQLFSVSSAQLQINLLQHSSRCSCSALFCQRGVSLINSATCTSVVRP